MISKELLRGIGLRYPTAAPGLLLGFSENPNALEDLASLYILANKKELYMKFNDHLDITSIIASGTIEEWSSIANREISVHFPAALAFRDETVINILPQLKNINSIKMADENPLNCLLTEITSRRSSFSTAIIRAILTEEFIIKTTKRGFSVTAEFIKPLNELPGIYILIKKDNEKIARVLLDGWSGYIFIDNEPPSIAYRDNNQVQEIILEIVAKHEK